MKHYNNNKTDTLDCKKEAHYTTVWQSKESNQIGDCVYISDFYNCICSITVCDMYYLIIEYLVEISLPGYVTTIGIESYMA